MPYGYKGKILHVDLTSSTLSVEELPEAFYRKYMGGQPSACTTSSRRRRPGLTR